MDMLGMVIFYIALCIAAGVIASNKGRSGSGFFFLAFFLSPIIGVIAAVIAKPNVKKTEAAKILSGEGKKCPFCAEVIKKEAVVCKHCGRDVPADIEPDKAVKLCPKCGTDNPAVRMSCSNCSTPFV